MHRSEAKRKGNNPGKLAEYLGVTKASVSKWESGQSYPIF
jgi:DNA-binding transcriptional regulator YiaG